MAPQFVPQTSSFEPPRLSSARGSTQELSGMESFAGCQLRGRGSRPSSFAGPAFPMPPELCRKPLSSATSSSPMSPSDSENNALLEALQQIDQLGWTSLSSSFCRLLMYCLPGTELDAYCEKVSPKGSVRVRTASSSRPPPPPERRGSTVTSNNHAPPSRHDNGHHHRATVHLNSTTKTSFTDADPCVLERDTTSAASALGDDERSKASQCESVCGRQSHWLTGLSSSR